MAKLWGYFEDGKPAIDELLIELGRENEKKAALNVYRSHKPDIHLYDGVAETIRSLKEKILK